MAERILKGMILAEIICDISDIFSPTNLNGVSVYIVLPRPDSNRERSTSYLHTRLNAQEYVVQSLFLASNNSELIVLNHAVWKAE